MAKRIYYGHPCDFLGDEFYVPDDDPLVQRNARGELPPLVYVLREGVPDDDPHVVRDVQRREVFVGVVPYERRCL